jgi:hypothetical protein
MSMKAIMLMSTLAVSLIGGATPSFAQATSFGPDYPYPQGYEELSPSGPAQFGSSEYGYTQGRARTGRVHAPRAQIR